MSASEIAERSAAYAWLQCGSTGGEGVNDLSNDLIGFRSMVGFRNEIITTATPGAYPLIILPLDRQMSRGEYAVQAAVVGTLEETGRSYPIYSAPQEASAYLTVAAQPILLAWLGSDLTAPTWLPFGITGGGVDEAFAPYDTFDAIALLLSASEVEGGFQGHAGDVVVNVLKAPRLESATLLRKLIPVPAP